MSKEDREKIFQKNPNARKRFNILKKQIKNNGSNKITNVAIGHAVNSEIINNSAHKEKDKDKRKEIRSNKQKEMTKTVELQKDGANVGVNIKRDTYNGKEVSSITVTDNDARNRNEKNSQISFHTTLGHGSQLIKKYNPHGSAYNKSMNPNGNTGFMNKKTK